MKKFSVRASERVFYNFLVEAENEKDAKRFIKDYGGEGAGWEIWITDGDDFEISEVAEIDDEVAHYWPAPITKSMIYQEEN